MIVYGDPQFSLTTNAFAVRLRNLLAQTDAHSLDSLRTLLIQIGQWEQGISDRVQSHPHLSELLEFSAHATDLAAKAFCHHWLSESGVAQSPDHVENTLNRLSPLLNRLTIKDIHALSIKVPEGFEFYALFPEQYCASTIRWAKHHARSPNHSALIIGIRSIGTTLSAVVSQTLAALGWATRRITVRPSGHPFDRQALLPSLKAEDIAQALIVDEGPGMSGSSLVSVAEALESTDFSGISFLPGHENDPGPQASAQVKERWKQTPRFFTALQQLRWRRKSLTDLLFYEAERLCDRIPMPHAPPTPVDQRWRFIHDHALRSLFDSTSSELHATAPHVGDCSGGLWRRFAYLSEAEWPPVATSFESLKFRCSDQRGNVVLWKFFGLGSLTGNSNGQQKTIQKLSRLADEGFTAAPLGLFRGFLATPWIEGLRLTKADAVDPSVQKRLGEYILAVADPDFSKDEKDASVFRLSEMLYWNTKEALGEAIAEQTRHWTQFATASEVSLAAGDGHLAPHEWISTDSGKILKTDCQGFACDHTIIGPQPIWWDIAGALIEWDLDTAEAEQLFAPFHRAGIAIDSATLVFYQLAYAAFRMGLMSMALTKTSDSAEHQRLQSGFYFYQNRLVKLLKTETTDFKTSP